MLHDPKYEQRLLARKILLDAADYIEEHGWCQKALAMSDGRVCIMGAINAATCGALPAPGPTGFEINDRLHRATGSISVASWNDAKGRTKEQVVAALRKAAQ